MDIFDKLLHDRLTDHVNVFQMLLSLEDVRSSIRHAAGIILDSIKNDGAVYLCGNGGSAADAQHIAAEFAGKFYEERRAMNAEALTVNASSLTAIGNDYAFDNVFQRQLEAKGRRGDVLIGMTTSGTSKNVARAMEYAAQIGIHTILLTGNKDNAHDYAVYECVVRVPSEDTPRIQEAHIFIGHMLAEYAERDLCAG